MKRKILDFEQPLIKLKKKIDEMKDLQESGELDLQGDIEALEEKFDKNQKEIYNNLSRWQRVKVARHPQRPHSKNFIEEMMTDFVELHGDRTYSDDEAVITGLARINEHKVAVIAQEKGRETEEKIERNFGMMHPEGYRKALRVMKLAEKFNLPILILIDTPGAYPGIGAEERGQAEAIAKNLFEMARLETPIILVIIGEGASGGALGVGLGDRLLMLENAWFSVISPEGCAAILYRDRSEAPKAAESLKVTADDLKELDIIDKIIPEPPGGAHWDPDEMVNILEKALIKELRLVQEKSIDQLLEKRYQKYRNMGESVRK